MHTLSQQRTRRESNGAHRLLFVFWAVVFGIVAGGCGSTKSRTATEQLLMSDAVDRAIAQIDFKELAGQKVFFDTKFVINTKDPVFIGNQKGLGFVNAEYVISSLRQQMVAADLRLQDKIEDADFVVEARLGAVGVDNNEVVYGVPASAPFSAAASAMSNAPMIPSIPEISFARKNIQVGAAKVGVFAYDRRSRQPVWQAGISQAVSDARDSWVLGIGPFQQGTIYRGTQFAGSRMNVPSIRPLPPMFLEEEPDAEELARQEEADEPLRHYAERHLFRPIPPPSADGSVQPASAQAPVPAGTPPANTPPANPPPPSSPIPNPSPPPSSPIPNLPSEPARLKDGPAQPVPPAPPKT